MFFFEKKNQKTFNSWGKLVINSETLKLSPKLSSSGFSRIYAFGDSLTDAGNDYAASGGLVPTSLIYSDGRFSNGRTWVQDLAKTLGLPAVKPSLNGGTDFAYGGAETGQDPLHTVLPIDLPAQLAEFVAQVSHSSAHALYALSIGANDVLDAIPDYASNPSAAESDVQTAVNNETAFVAGLALDGAKTFLIMNVPDLGKTPEEAGNATTATYLSNLYDQELASALGTLGAQGPSEHPPGRCLHADRQRRGPSRAIRPDQRDHSRLDRGLREPVQRLSERAWPRRPGPLSVLRLLASHRNRPYGVSSPRR